jgi:hypothetical protein
MSTHLLSPDKPFQALVPLYGLQRVDLPVKYRG